MPAMSEPRRKRGAERTSNRGLAPSRSCRRAACSNPYPPMALLSADQVEAIHEASLHILENFGIEVMSARALAAVREGRRQGRPRDADGAARPRAIVEAALATAPSSYTLTPRNPDRAVHLGGDTINFTLVAGPPNVHDMERGRRAGNMADYRDLVRLAQHFNCIPCWATRSARRSNCRPISAISTPTSPT